MNLLKQSGKHIFKNPYVENISKKKKGNPYGTFQDENNSILKLKKKKWVDLKTV